MAIVVAQIVVSLHDDGSLSTSGNIGDVQLALKLLDHAKDAIRGNTRAIGNGIVTPNRDVVVPQDPQFPFGPIAEQST